MSMTVVMGMFQILEASVSTLTVMRASTGGSVRRKCRAGIGRPRLTFQNIFLGMESHKEKEDCKSSKDELILIIMNRKSCV